MQLILDQLNLKADVIDVENIGNLSKYHLRLNPGGTVKKIENRVNEIALGMRSYSIPFVRVVPEDGIVVVEMLTEKMGDVKFVDLINELQNEKYVLQSKKDLPVIVGKEYTGKPLIADLTKMPHLLIAGTTGSGKSVLLHSLICSLIIQNNSSLKLVLIDPKNVEFLNYKNIKQLMRPIANTPDEAYSILSDLVLEMDKRFRIMARASVRSISEYNVKKKKKMPYIVVVIDEFADLMLSSKNEFQLALGRLAQKSRSCGIHIIIATQRPSADIITGSIKANCPASISFKVISNTNSRIVLDQPGAEKLMECGDGIIKSSKYDMVRFKGAFIRDDEISYVCDSNKKSFTSKLFNYILN